MSKFGKKIKQFLCFAEIFSNFPQDFIAYFQEASYLYFLRRDIALFSKKVFISTLVSKKKWNSKLLNSDLHPPPLSLSLQILQNKTTEFVLRCTSTPPLLKKKRCFYLYDYVCSNYLFPQNYLILLHFLVFSMFWVRTC